MSHDHDDPHHGDHSHIPADVSLRVKALETVLTQRGYLDTEALDTLIDAYQNKVGPRNGAQVVAKAWTDPDFKARLLANGTEAIMELGLIGLQAVNVKVVENTPAVHNMVVCTLCSCYPWSLLGLPPSWYKSFAYRSRTVSEPRAVLAEFGVELSDDIGVEVWDSTAEIRYLVLPQRPADTEGLSETELAELVTRNGMVGTALV